MNWVARYYDVEWVCTGEPDAQIDYAVYLHNGWSVHVQSTLESVVWTVCGFQRYIVGTGRVVTLKTKQLSRVSAAMKMGLHVLRQAQADRADWEPESDD